MAANYFLQKPNKKMFPVIDYKNTSLLIVPYFRILNKNKYLEEGEENAQKQQWQAKYSSM